jgi:sulfoxide reductase heme-binding subunit YedZ
MKKGLILALRIIVHAGALWPLAWILWDLVQGHLGANPIREIQLRTGAAAINLLMASLACTPIYILTGFNPVLTLRAPLGLYAFLYASLHFFNFLGVDYSFNLGLIRDDLFKKRYAILGFAAFLLLLPLAAVSLGRLKKRMGANWRKLKWLVYPASILAVLHFILLTRAGFHVPLTYAGVLALLLLLRLPPIRQAAMSLWSRRA